MKKRCQQFIHWLEKEPSDLTGSWREHLQHCPQCATLWHRERAYRKLIQSVRSEPVPSSQLPWSAIASRLSQPTPKPQFSFRLSWAVATASVLVISFGIAWVLMRDTQRNHLAMPTPPSPQKVARMPDQPVQQKASTVSVPIHSDGESKLTSPAPSSKTFSLSTSQTYKASKGTAPSQSLHLALEDIQETPPAIALASRGVDATRGGEHRARFHLAMLPPEPIIPLGDEQVEYLPVQYGQPPETDSAPETETVEEMRYEGIICSF